MATFNEMAISVYALIVNTLVLIVLVVAGGPILDWLSVWLSGQAAGPISGAPLQNIFGLFYALIIACEICLFAAVFITAIRRTDYGTQEADF